MPKIKQAEWRKVQNFGDVSGDYGIGGIIGNLSKELPSDLEEIDIPSIDDVLFTRYDSFYQGDRFHVFK